MKKETKKVQRRRRKCRNCGELYRPDPRAKKSQKYCSAPECRQVSQSASWQHWFNRPENKDYYKGPDQVERTRDWRRKNPGYWRRVSKAENALPKEITPKSTGIKGDTHFLMPDALQKEILLQPPIIVGLIANLTGSTLPKDIVESSRKFILLGEDVLGIVPSINPRGGRDDEETHYIP